MNALSLLPALYKCYYDKIKYSQMILFLTTFTRISGEVK